MKSRLMITGANGLLGSHLIPALKEDYSILTVDLDRELLLDADVQFKSLDITDYPAMEKAVRGFRPDFLINCASYTNVDGCEINPEKAYLVNAEAVRFLTEICTDIKCRIIHFSTDYVFDGREGPYSENARVNPLSVYGKTKLASENFIRASGGSHLILRINVLFGNGPRREASFVHWVITELKTGRSIRVVDDQYNNPTWAGSLSECVKMCMENRLEGLYHFGGRDYLNRLEFAYLIAEVYNLDKSLINRCKTSDLNQPAPRPLKGGLKTERIEKDLKINPVKVREALLTMKREDG